VTLYYALWGLCLLSIMASLWASVCAKRTVREIDKINENILYIIVHHLLELERPVFIHNEFADIKPRDYFWKLVFFRNPDVLLGPALQMIRRGGWLCPADDNDRWWLVYEKAYLIQPEYIRNAVTHYMVRHKLELEYALTIFGCEVDHFLYQANENTQTAMAAAALEYDEAMISQQIMKETMHG